MLVCRRRYGRLAVGVALTPEQLYIAMSNAIVDVCGGTSPVRQTPITIEEWQSLRHRWDLICSFNMPRLEEKANGNGTGTEAERRTTETGA